MKNTIIKSLSIIIVVLMMISITSCDIFPIGTTTTSFVPTDDIQYPERWNDALYTEDTELGEGEKTFLFVVDADGYSITFTIHTNKDIVGEALVELGLLAGEEGQYGLYVKTVNGMLADWDVDQSYWAFYENGLYANGVDATNVTEGYTYSFVRTK